MIETSNLKLKIFEADDNFDYEVLNQNADVIDGAVSNENLLMNPFFTINQRGVTASSWSSNRGYGLDRWLANNAFTCSSIEDGVTITGGVVFQLMETHELGKTYTLSAKVNGKIKSGTFTLPSQIPTSTMQCCLIQIDDVIISANLLSSGAFQGCNCSGTGKIEAVKLEYGTVSTLANDHAPNYATELLKCQRYFIKRRITAFPNLTTGGQFGCFFNARMRTTPTVSTVVNSAQASGGARTFTLSSVSGVSMADDYIYFNVNGTWSGTFDYTAKVYLTASISADL